MEIREADVADEAPSFTLAGDPVAIPEQGPEAGVPKNAGPDFLRRRGTSTDVARDFCIAPHLGTLVKIGECVRTQYQAGGFDEWRHRQSRFQPGCRQCAEC